MGGLPFLGQYNTPIFTALGVALSIIMVLLCVGKSNSPVKLILIGMGMTGVRTVDALKRLAEEIHGVKID